jgi:hypothetical protein
MDNYLFGIPFLTQISNWSSWQTGSLEPFFGMGLAEVWFIEVMILLIFAVTSA